MWKQLQAPEWLTDLDLLMHYKFKFILMDIWPHLLFIFKQASSLLSKLVGEYTLQVNAGICQALLQQQFASQALLQQISLSILFNIMHHASSIYV
jgi:hypothetical protein